MRYTIQIDVEAMRKVLARSVREMDALDLELQLKPLRKALYSRIMPGLMPKAEKQLPYFYYCVDQTVHLAAGGEEDTAATDAASYLREGNHDVVWFFADPNEMEQHIANRGRGIDNAQ